MKIDQKSDLYAPSCWGGVAATWSGHAAKHNKRPRRTQPSRSHFPAIPRVDMAYTNAWEYNKLVWGKILAVFGDFGRVFSGFSEARLGPAAPAD